MDMNEMVPRMMRIWIAEDDDEFRVILENALAREERTVRSFKNGHEVLEALEKEVFDILLTDLMMPGMDGIQILKEVKRVHPESVVIIITGYAPLDTAIQAIRGGAYDYICKPFKLEELEIIIKNAFEKISLMRENMRLLQKLKETVDELNHSRGTWDEHFANILGLCWMVSNDQKNSEMQLILNQINPMPPDYDLNRSEVREKKLDGLEKLIQYKKEGFIDQTEFSLLKKIWLHRLNGR